MNRSLPVGILLLVLGMAAWLLWPRGELAAPEIAVPIPTLPAADAPVASAVLAEPPATPADAAAAPERTAAPVAPGASNPECILRGRCIDAAGQPIAGLQATLTGWGANDQRVQAWLSKHEEPARIDQKLTTGPDGVFEFRFWPPPPFQFALRLLAEGSATWGNRWNELEPGTTKDLGDLQMVRGTRLRGRVVDADGGPIGKVEVRIDQVERLGREGGFEGWTTARTGTDGAFVARWALAAGDYKLGIDDQQIERGALVTLTGEPDQTVEVVLKRLDDRDAIRGVVVDQAGAPVRGAYVHPSISGSGRLISTDQEGRFRVPRPAADAPASVRLSVTRNGYEAEPNETEYAWGRNDLRLVLRKGLGLEILVVRASDGAPVEDYTLRVVPISGNSFSSDDQRPRGKSPHPGGRESVDGIRIGQHQVIVEPKGNEYAVGVAVATITATGAPQAVVRLAAAVPRQVRVRFADDRPVTGARVQLIDPLGEPLTSKSYIYQLSEWGNTSANKALVLDHGITDERGEVTLHAPADRPLGLNLPGPAHAPLVMPAVVFPDAGPFVVTVGEGAVLLATVGPAAVLAEIRNLAGAGQGEEMDAWRAPGLSVHGGAPEAQTRFPDHRERCSMQPDGTFALRGVPAGRWRIVIHCFRKDENGGNFLEMPAGTVDLVAGQETKLAIDLSALLPSRIGRARAAQRRAAEEHQTAVAGLARHRPQPRLFRQPRTGDDRRRGPV